ncbi:MAG TPA: TetR/AcrR family transcriptional regulator [Solirubrobacterales bacterium]|nr:TetR/AcrR family transcriptional regulator [Solirubrobacterales bacterium]
MGALRLREQMTIERILRATAEVVCELGLQRMTVALIIERAAVSRATFYQHFDNGDDAYRRAVALAGDSLEAAIEAGRRSEGTWEERLRGLLIATLAAVAEEPAFGGLCLLHAYGRPEAWSPYHPILIEPLTAVLRSGREEMGAGWPPHTEDFIACGILSVLADRLRHAGVPALEGLTDELVELVCCWR